MTARSEHGQRAGTLALAVELGSPASARATLASGLEDAGCEGLLVRDALMVASELLMNALVHGEGDADGLVHLVWSVDDDCTVTLEVRDSGGVGVPHLESPSVAESGGRGLVLVDALSDTWTIDAGDGPTTVAAVLTPTGASRSGAR